MNHLFKTLLGLLLVFPSCTREESMQELSDRVFALAQTEFTALAATLDENRMPRNVENGELVTSPIKWWCSGFFPGSLWYVYEYTGSEAIKALALQQTAKVEPIKYVTRDHDVGFQMNCSFGNAYRLTGNPDFIEVLNTAAHSLATRFNPTVGCTKSWNHVNEGKDWNFPVIIDNMMNLELLLVAHQLCGDPALKEVALTHARTTLRNHFRQDYSCYHLVDYNPATGEVRYKETVQGHANESAWARGQAWALYGFTMMAQMTAEADFLDQAEHIARMLLSRLPQDGIPFWDFDAPDIPKAPRDASAGAIMASALVKLSTLTQDPANRSAYLAMAEKQLRSLASKAYLAEPGELHGFLLKHSVGNLPKNSEVDVPLTYADYYFLEALLRYRQLQ